MYSLISYRQKMCKDREREEIRMREHHSNFISSKELGEWREDEGQAKYYCGEIIGNTSLDGKLFRDRTRSSQIRWTQWPAPAPCLLDHQTLASTLKYTGTEEVKRCRRKGENYHFKMVGKGFDLIQIFANRESIKLDGQVKMNQNSYNESVLWSVGTKPGKVGLWKEPTHFVAQSCQSISF